MWNMKLGSGAAPGTRKEGLLRTDADGELNWSMAYAPAGANHHEDNFYNNCLISCGLIGSFVSSMRVQTDKILIYASFQQFNVQLSYCQPFNQWDFVDFLK